MKKIAISIISIIFVVFLGVFIYLLFPKVKGEIVSDNLNQKSVEEMFTEKGHFYVFFSREDCRYCENIAADIKKFANTEKVYTVDPELCENIKSYDWDKHELENDVEVGKMLEDGKIEYYDELTEKDIKEKYPPLYYKIVLANEGYAELHNGKEAGKIYAISTRPILEDSEFQVDNFVIPAIPILIEFNNNKVVNYYFDDKEIIDFLDSDTVPLDKYWNLE